MSFIRSCVSQSGEPRTILACERLLIRLLGSVHSYISISRNKAFSLCFGLSFQCLHHGKAKTAIFENDDADTHLSLFVASLSNVNLEYML